MAKPINLPADYVAKHMEKVRNELSGRNYKIDKLKLSIPLESDDRRAIVYFTLKAWTKMNALVRDFKTEVQWHGIADRICENQFIVQDLLIFPHEATEV
ncbi:MAG: hypothetical protein FWC11_03190, partial [Firmicutes bacterium]|nr:hypothetical protein [Bacillota bacterium]